MIVIWLLYTDLEEWSEGKSMSYSFGGGWYDMNKSKEIEKHETFGKRRVTHFISGLMVA